MADAAAEVTIAAFQPITEAIRFPPTVMQLREGTVCEQAARQFFGWFNDLRRTAQWGGTPEFAKQPNHPGERK